MNKLDAVKRAIELGAEIGITFHDVRSEKDAQQVAREFKDMGNGQFIKEQNGEHRWLEFDTTQKFGIAIHYDETGESLIDVQEISNRLKLLRTNKKLTQQEAAERLKIKRERLNAWENGIAEPGLEMLGKLCGFYGISVVDLTGITINNPTSN